MSISPVFAVHPAILRFERTIRCLTGAEITGFISAEGICILTLHGVDTGNGFFTVIPDEMNAQITGTILTHNHPSDSSFTKRDLEEAPFFALKEIRVVGRTGIYSMKPGPGGWPAPQVTADCFTAIEGDPYFFRQRLILSVPNDSVIQKNIGQPLGGCLLFRGIIISRAISPSQESSPESEWKREAGGNLISDGFFWFNQI